MKISTGVAERIEVNGEGRCGGAVERQRKKLLVANTQSMKQKMTMRKKKMVKMLIIVNKFNSKNVYAAKKWVIWQKIVIGIQTLELT